MSECRFEETAKVMQGSAKRRVEQLQRKRSVSRERESRARQDMIEDRDRSIRAKEIAIMHARQTALDSTERELEWERRQNECLQKQEGLSELKSLERRLWLKESESRGRPHQQRWRRKDIRYEDDPKEVAVRQRKRSNEILGYKAILEEEMIRSERAQLVSLNKLHRLRSESEVRVNKSYEFEEKKEISMKIREDIVALKESTLRDEIKQKDAVYIRNKSIIKRHIEDWVEDHKRRQSSRSIEVEKRRISIEDIKRKQRDYLHQVFEERASKVLKLKCDFESSKKEYFHQKVIEHDESILQKRRNAELIKVLYCLI